MQLMKLSARVKKNWINYVNSAFGERNSKKETPHVELGKKICQPKERGGWGLKKASDVNQAMLAKTYWRLLIEQDSVRSNVIWERYDIWKPIHDHSGVRPRSPYIWRSIS